MDLCRFIVILFLGCCGFSSADEEMVYNISLTNEDLANYADNGLDIILDSMLKVYCTSNQDKQALYNLDEQEYNDCTIPPENANFEIGHCQKGVLTIIVNSAPIIGFSIDYTIGNTYYFGLFNSTGARAEGNTLCNDGFKFKLNVIAEPMPTEPQPVVVSSTIVPSLSSTVTFTEPVSSTVAVEPTSALTHPSTETLQPTREPTTDPTTEPTRETIDTDRTLATTDSSTRDPSPQVGGANDSAGHIKVSILLLTVLSTLVFYHYRLV